jgi:broad specificity phosphatase PhoE
MPQLLLIRHGEPEGKGRLLGRCDPGLSPAGHDAARQALAHIEAAIAYVSPLQRAQQTAAYLPAHIPRVTLPQLPEISLGEWEGLLWAEVEQRWPELACQKLERWLDIPAPGGEPWPEVLARATSVLEIVRRGPFPAVIVAHHGINSVLSSLLTGCDPHTHQQAYCQIFHHEVILP